MSRNSRNLGIDINRAAVPVGALGIDLGTAPSDPTDRPLTFHEKLSKLGRNAIVAANQAELLDKAREAAGHLLEIADVPSSGGEQ